VKKLIKTFGIQVGNCDCFLNPEIPFKDVATCEKLNDDEANVLLSILLFEVKQRRLPITLAMLAFTCKKAERPSSLSSF
jgi:hypothetical protein